MENSSSASYLQKIQNPVLQAASIFGVVLLINILAKFFQSAGLEIEQRFPWTIAASFMLFFAILNSLVSLLAKNLENYWGRSIMSFMALAALSGGAAYLFSTLTINEAGSYRWLYIVLTFGYLMFLVIIGMMRKIVEFAQREEWNNPKIRKRRR